MAVLRNDVSTLPSAIARLVGALLLEQNDQWAVQHARYIIPEASYPSAMIPIVGLPIAAD